MQVICVYMIGLKQPLKAQVSYMKGWFLLLLYYILSPSLHLCPQRMFPAVCWQKNWNLEPGLWFILYDMQATPVLWTDVALQPVSGISLKEVVTGSPPVSRNLSSVPKWSWFLEREMARLMICGKWITHTYTCTYICICISQFSSVQLLSHVRLFATPWIAAR